MARYDRLPNFVSDEGRAYVANSAKCLQVLTFQYSREMAGVFTRAPDDAGVGNQMRGYGAQARSSYLPPRDKRLQDRARGQECSAQRFSFSLVRQLNLPNLAGALRDVSTIKGRAPRGSRPKGARRQRCSTATLASEVSGAVIGTALSKGLSDERRVTRHLTPLAARSW